MTRMFCSLFLFVIVTSTIHGQALDTKKDNNREILVSKGRIHEATSTHIAIEAEHYQEQDKRETRQWYTINKDHTPNVEPDGDPPHIEGASNGAYLEVLPDTRRTHGDKLIRGENFTNQGGEIAVLTYHVKFKVPGKYYVWVRAYSTGTEDNGIHAGLDGQWPESGARMQWCEWKHSWHWESKQRTQEVHCGVPYQIYLQVDEPGLHEVHFSMREDGFEFDKFILTTERDFTPEGYDRD